MKLTVGKITSLGIQHVLAMYAGAVIVPLIVGASIGLTPQQLTYLVSIDILMSGIATLLQVWKNKYFGIGLPVVLGCTFTAVAPMVAIGNGFGIGSIYGSIIISGLFVILIAKYFSKIVKFFPPVVTGSVVTIIGITLIPVAMNNLAGGQGSEEFGSLENVALGFGTLMIILLIFRFAKGFLRSIAILIGILTGTLIAFFMGMVDFSPVVESSWLHMPKLFYLAVPEFHIVPIITMILVAIVSLVESTGVYFALSDIVEKKLTEDDLAKGYRAEGLAIFLGGFFNAFPYTTFSQNVGLVQLSGVKSRNVIFAAGTILIFLGIVPKIGAFTTIIPSSVLGGAMIAMFGMVIASGVKMLSKVDFTSQGNLLIVALSIGMGLGVTVVPELFVNLPQGIRILMESGIVVGSITAVMLNIVFNMMRKKGSQMMVTLTEQKATS
ncbi:nucleobase:cation symporter-2 family protein [Fervidibacillus halotolerans]|uniref:Purine permease n=1 Tax=Fervidibacillus halotolerans TaxID=2980027 RepID=A0A9E8RZE7_9BACI|nr:nucleobase:cation symporter-2 family protein [Fervidibacillus halotolerans]WAA13263.1 purine permease [Fervidibacillus halotolerans]